MIAEHIPVCCLGDTMYKLCNIFVFSIMFYHPISMQAEKPMREDNLAISAKVASVKINHACNDT